MNLKIDGNIYICFRGYPPDDCHFEIRQTENGTRDHFKSLNGWISDKALIGVTKIPNREIIDRMVILNRKLICSFPIPKLDDVIAQGRALITTQEI